MRDVIILLLPLPLGAALAAVMAIIAIRCGRKAADDYWNASSSRNGERKKGSDSQSDS